MDKTTDQQALDFHQYPKPGKIAIQSTKSLATKKDLALAYSPGVAAPCLAIQKNPKTVYDYTSKGNLVGVISNGTAVLGLGNIGALASKPVMEGKAVLFKKFAGVDVFDLEINEQDPDKFIEIVAALEPTFGGINLEDIKSPECFYIEEALRARMNIPVFHDDQHGTAIVASAALLNGLKLVNKEINKIKVIVSGAGSAALACLKMFVVLGVRVENITLCDSKGVVYQGRAGVDEHKACYATKDSAIRTLAEAMKDADLFLGCSVANVLTDEMLKNMASQPIILALANPNPEILPDQAHAVRDDAIICTGRSDYPNQVNNILCFPFIFRAALDVGATEINEAMKLACVHAIAEMVFEQESSGKGESLIFGQSYVIPSPFDARLIYHLVPKIAKAAMDSGVATKPITCFEQYINELKQLIAV